jgi:hypothetical protein
VIPVAKLLENGTGTEVPARPGERSISIHVFGIQDCTCIKQKLDSFFAAKGRRSVERSFSFGSTVSHKGTCFGEVFCRAIGVRAIGEQYFDDVIVGRTIGFA